MNDENIRKVEQIFLNGNCLSIKELNQFAGINNSREIISILRNEKGLRIDNWKLPNGRKVYSIIASENKLVRNVKSMKDLCNEFREKFGLTPDVEEKIQI